MHLTIGNGADIKNLENNCNNVNSNEQNVNNFQNKLTNKKLQRLADDKMRQQVY